MKIILLVPLLLPLLMATLSLLPRQWRLDRELLALLGSAGHLGCAITIFVQVYQNGIIIIEVGAWSPPFGIVLVYDLLSCLMLLAVGLLGFAVSLYSIASVDPMRQAFGYFPMLHLLIMGCSGSFLAGDLFNLYVWFEVILISSFVLLTLGGEKKQLMGGIKYVTINMVSSTLLLIAIGLLYAQMGTLNMADLAQRAHHGEIGPALSLTSILFMVSFFIKAGVFPFFFWLPDSYHTPPIAVTAIFSGLLTKVGVYALFRFFTLVFVPHSDWIHQLFLWLAAITMVTGVLGAWSEMDIRKILSFHIISQIGYMVIGLALFTPMALAGSIYFLLHNILAKSNLFLISGVIGQLGKSYNLNRLGGLYGSFFLLSMLFLIPALSLAGVPPLSGFFGKLTLIKAGLAQEENILVLVALLVSVMTTLSMLKIWHYSFWQPAHQGQTAPQTQEALGPAWQVLIMPIILLATGTLALGFFAEFFLEVSTHIADQLLDPELYIQAVLGARP